MTKSDIFWKSWWWSAVCGAAVALLFLLITTIPIFDGLFRVLSYVDVLVVLSIVGCYVGAGYVGARIAAKYYNADGRLARRYIRFSVISFIVLVALAFSPLSFLMIAWSFIAPYCVLLTLKAFMPAKTKQAPRARRRTA
jgi:hypothetical protein